MTKKEMQNQVVSLKEELLKLRFQAATGQLQHFHKIKETRREIARLLTKLNMETFSKESKDE